jgi:anaerobic magnesium-protoporphyrin IX monomethyl ester cyclase
MKILLATLHAKYIHSSLALPCLAASIGESAGIETVIREFTINEPADQVLRSIVAEQPDITAFSCYIWNIVQTLKLASDLKKVLPATKVILGGPEVSYNAQEILRGNRSVDCIIMGEGEEIFRRLVAEAAQTGNFAEALKTVPAGIAFRNGNNIIITPIGKPVVNLDTIPSPFNAGLVEINKPLVYYETSRGCPFSCAFCMSSLGTGVRSFSMERIREDLLYLIRHKAATVKLVDRTFNYEPARADSIWDFIISNNHSSRFHFEIAADLLTESNIRMLEKAPAGMFRFEIGVQSAETTTLEKVGRKTDLDRLFANVEKLLSRTGVIIHLDLVAGLPGEGYGGFLASLQRLLRVGPHHIQVEPLKVLKGSPMEEIAAREGYAFSDYPPYKILATPYLSFDEINRIETVARLLDVYLNSGRFVTLLEVLSKREPLSGFFDDMATSAKGKGLSSGVSQRGSFEYIWDFINGRGPESGREPLRDALSYDFCLCEYPTTSNLPDFMGQKEISCADEEILPSKSEIVKSLRISRDSKVRTFMHHFRRDYTSSPWKEEGTGIIFVYISAAGEGLKVKTIPVKDKACSAP